MKLFKLSLFFLFVFITSCSIFNPAVVLGGKALVVVGSRYDTQNDLRATILDGMEMAILLKNNGYEVTFLVDDGTLPNFSEDPAPALVNSKITEYKNIFTQVFGTAFQASTKNNLKQALKNIRETIKPQQTFAFFYAGHSGSIASLGKEDIFSQGDNEVLAFPSYTSMNSNTYLSDDELAAEMALFPFSVPKILIFDSCRSGGFIGQEGTFPLLGLDDPTSTPYIPQNWSSVFNSTDIVPSIGIVLSASPELRDSAGDGDAGDFYLASGIYHGYFTYTLLQAVKNPSTDSNRDGYISASEIYTFSRDTIGQLKGKDTSGKLYNINYRPRISGGPYDIILFKTP